jgi:hypothetical protein
MCCTCAVVIVIFIINSEVFVAHKVVLFHLVEIFLFVCSLIFKLADSRWIYERVY